ncbi:ATP-binding cassette domain-containing protein [Cryobacterium sp. MP_3.1]|uniref:ABC transporter ATP-binding protein n=1 Tax=Cryobacterium sp. MP_3.1 TaxID=3071711 RepID=UPI003FA34D36
MRRTPRTTTSPAGGASNAPAASGADTSVPADAATPDGSATPVKPARSTTRAPRTPATPRATSTPRAPAKKKPAAAALAEDVSVPTTTPVTPAAAEPATSPARVTVTRTPAARKAPVKPAVAKATRLPATTTSTADTAEAVEAAAAASEQDLPAGPVEVGPEKPKTAAARSSSARTAASKAAAAKAAAAKTESATKAGAARAAATKSAAAKSAAARTAATASARAATAAAAAAAAARSAAVDDAPAAAESVTEEPVTKAPVTAVPDPAAPATPGPDATMVLPVVPAAPASSADDETVVLTTPASPDSDDTVVLTVTPATSAPATEPAPPAKRPFWRLPRFAPKQTEAVSPTDLGVAERTDAATAEAPARPEPVVGATAQRIPPVVRKPMAPRTGASAVIGASPRVEIAVSGLNKSFGQNVAVADVNLEVRAGSFYGIVGPNGAGKTTTLSMITGLLRPDSGSIQVHGVDVWADPIAAKRTIGVLPDRLRLFDRLTGAQLLYYSGVLRGLESETVRARSADLAAAFGLEDALNRLVADYSAGMTKKIALACAMIHSPRVLVLDEPFESVDPVSAVNVTEILQRYVAAGGTVILSSHGMDLIQRVCDHVAIIVQGSVLAAGTIDEVRGNVSLEERFVDLAGGRKVAEGLEWLHNFSD